ncbi:MAG: response regulator [Thiovulaceae bacterium]|nr:response regulator [Sulfurimonadaceae bacterium]
MTSEKILKLKKMGQHIKILYVEDDKSVSEQFYKFLKKIFRNVYIASNGVDALKIYKKSNYDIVITDIEMPQMDGIEMIEKMRIINEDQAIIVTSAYNNSQYLLKLIDNHIDKFILKPFNHNNVFKIISKLVVQIYREKKLEQKEVKLKNVQILNNILFNKMDAPLLVINDNIVEFFNNKFTHNFNSTGKCVISKYFDLCNLFDNDYTELNNKEIIENLLDNPPHVKKLRIQNNKSKKFIINIVKLENKRFLLSFYNVDTMCSKVDSTEYENKMDKLTSLYTREAFELQLEDIVNDKNEYSTICFGLKNIKELIDSFGAKSLRDIYSHLGYKLINFFKNEIDDDKMKLYYFDRNHFVAVVENTKLEITKRVLTGFGEHMGYSKDDIGLYEPFHLDVLSKDIKKKQTNKNIMAQIDNMLYMLHN